MPGNPETASINIRAATPSDAGLIHALICELAEYERLSHEVSATIADLSHWLFGPHRCAEALIAEWNQAPAGFALFFHNFSTFLGKPGLYLEDLYVRPALRGRGIGKALLQRLARIATERGCGRMEWAVLDWNTPAIDFYQSLHATPMNQWTVFRLNGPSLEKLASPM
jgi:GNAT superfamily N-acetyltransferase